MASTDVLPARPRVSTLADHAVVLGLGAALAYGALEQGAFYGRQLTTLVLLVAVAGIARATLWRRRVAAPVAVAAGALLVFACWALVRAAMAGDVTTGYPMAALTCCLAVAAVAAAGLPAASQRVLLVVVLAVATIVAASCWVGVALHVEPLALPSSGLWRASSTLTYANTTAAFLVIGLVIAIGATPIGSARTVVVAVLALGLLATMSRAGGIGLVVALGAYLGLTRDTARLRPLVPVVPAVAVAGAALLPSLPVETPADPWLALAGLGAGTLVLVLGRGMRPVHLLAGIATVAVAVVVALLVLAPAREAVAGIASTRLTTESAERADLSRVTAAQFRTSPLVGVGPGRLDLHYVDYAGRPVHAVFTHDEYLQTAAETGVVGLVAAVAALVALAVGGIRRRTTEGAVAAATVAGFAAHSAFDFLWHVPALPLLLTVCAAVLITSPSITHREEPS